MHIVENLLTMNDTNKEHVTNPNEIQDSSNKKRHNVVYNKTNNLVPRKEKNCFWKSFFGKKKNKGKMCNYDSANAICMKDERILMKTDMKHSRENKLPIIGCNIHGTKPIKNQRYPEKWVLPIERNGCGWHLYFTIDNKNNKQNILKNTKIKNMDTLTVGESKDKKYLDPCLKNSGKDLPKIKSVCRESKSNCESLCTRRSKSLNQQNKYFKCKDQDTESIYNYSKYHTPFQQNKNLSPEMKNIKQCDPYEFHINIGKFDKEPKTNKEAFTSDNDNVINKTKYENRSSKPILKPSYYNMITEGKVVEKEEYLNKRTEETLPKFSDKVGNSSIGLVKKDNLEKKYIPKPYTEWSDYNIKSDNICSSTTDINHGGTAHDDNAAKDKRDETITSTSRFKDNKRAISNTNNSYEEGNLRECNDNIRRKASKKSVLILKDEGFVRNSLISIRKQVRQSRVEGRMSEILRKLNLIEEKLLEIEKKYENRKKNILMGISCDDKNSKISVNFCNPNDDTKISNQALLTLDPSLEILNQPRKIKSQDKDIDGNKRDEINMRPLQRVKAGSSKAKQLACNDSLQLDAQIITAHSLHNFNNSKEGNTLKRNQVLSIICNKWRRISEELKV